MSHHNHMNSQPKATPQHPIATTNDPITLFITWTTYGTWLPGDSRGWQKHKDGAQQPQPMLEEWCRDRLTEKPIVLDSEQRLRVENVIREHARHRKWYLHALSVRSNHIHVAITAKAQPQRVRDQLKANGTRVLRQSPNALINEKVWTRGGDIRVIDSDEDLENVVLYITEAQDRMGKGK